MTRAADDFKSATTTQLTHEHRIGLSRSTRSSNFVNGSQGVAP